MLGNMQHLFANNLTVSPSAMSTGDNRRTEGSNQASRSTFRIQIISTMKREIINKNKDHSRIRAIQNQRERMDRKNGSTTVCGRHSSV